MKKVLFLVLFIPAILNAQQNKPFEDLNFGIQAGLNFSSFRNPIAVQNGILSESSRTALPLLGANITLPFNKYLNLRIGGQYSMKGTNYLTPIYCKVRYNYFDFPVLAQIKTGDFLRFEAGLVPSFLLNSKLYFHSAGDSVVKLPVKGSGMEIALHLGAEVTLQEGLDIGFSYEMPTNSSSFDNYKFTLTYKFSRDVFVTQPVIKSNVAYVQIKEIKNNAILVRLKTSENQINALKEMGRIAEAEQIQEKQRSINLEIMNAFKRNFNFCPVFFFYSSSSYNIRHNNYNGHLLNENLIPDSSVKFYFNKAYIAEFDFIDPDTNYVDRELYDQKSYKADSSVSVSNTHLEEALVLRNSYFTQLKEPLPSYVKMEEWLKRKTYAMAVSILNQQLHNFYNQAMRSGNH